MKKENCPFHRNGSGPVKVGSPMCQRYQREKKGNCQSCEHNQPPSVAAPTTPAPTPQEENVMYMPTLSELHNELFKQLRRLNADELKGEELKREVERSHAVTSLSQTMINNAALVLKAHLGVANSVGSVTMPSLITQEDPTGREDERAGRSINA